MLADDDSRRAALGAAGPADPSPEQAPDPKSAWATRAGEADLPPERDGALFRDQMRRAAWAALRPDVVAHRCPLGFAPFLGALRRDVLPLLAR